jgi:hypothetical protein
MARPLAQFLQATASPVEAESRRRLDQSTARALAAAVAALAIATIVVGQSSRALNPEGTAAANSFESGTVALVDDDEGRSLVDLDNMAPGRPSERCITVTYAGTILPVDVTIAAETTGDVAPYLLVEVERGSAGRYGDCAAFVADESIFDGRMSDLAWGDPLAVGTLRNEGDEVSFRFTFDLADEADAAGRSGSVDFVWEAVPR